MRNGLPSRHRARATWAWAIALAAVGGLARPPTVAARPAAAPVWCHELRRGDSLARVARLAGVSVERLRRLNALTVGETARLGDIVALPALVALEGGRLRPSARPLPARLGHPARENLAADAQRLTRLRTRPMLKRFRWAGLLVPVAAEGLGSRVVGVPPWRRVARPWTRRFIRQLGEAMRVLFDARLRVTDLARTEAVQEALRASNGNAAPARGRHRSSHLTGASVDLSKAEHSEVELGWLRLVLWRLRARGVVMAIEEFAQPHFHVMVLRQYAAYSRRLRSPALIGGC